MPSKGKSKAQKKAVVQTAPPQKEAAASGSASDFPAEATLDEDLTSSASRVATECSAVIKTFVQGARPKAKKALQKLAKEFPRSPLPHRYLARLLYHEAATLETLDVNQANRQRLELLQEALGSASTASDLCPASLSCAALRATMVVNVLVEASTSIAGSFGAARASLPSGRQCEDTQQEFQGAYEACKRGLAAQPVLNEPVICISTISQKTCDPCCLRIQDQVQAWVKEGRWQELLDEKREVLLHMQDVLRSCHTLLQTTSIPMNGVVNLLQHILKPHQEELKIWASQLLLTKGAVLDTMEKQAAMSDFLKRIKPHEGAGMPAPAIPGSASDPMPRSVQLDSSAAQSSLSIDRDFENGKEPIAMTRRKPRKTNERRNELTMQERYQDVKDFWLKQSPNTRKELLQVPVKELLQDIVREHGQATAEDLEHGLSLLRDYSNLRACFWICPFCPTKEGAPQQFATAKDFLIHVETSHEGVQISSDELPHLCLGCNADVVGDHYRSTVEPSCVLCQRCHHLELTSGAQDSRLHSFERVSSHDPAIAHAAWEDDSEFYSSRGSFGSIDEEYVRDSLAALGSKLPPGALPPLSSAEASQWFDDWNQSMEAQMRSRLALGPGLQQAHGQGQVLQPPAAIGQPVLGQPVYPQPPLPDAASSKGSNSMQPHSNAITNGMPVEQPVSGQAWLNGPLPKSVRAPPPSRPAESDVGQASHAWGVDGQDGSSVSQQSDPASWRSLFPNQLELWRSAYTDKNPAFLPPKGSTAASQPHTGQHGQQQPPWAQSNGGFLPPFSAAGAYPDIASAASSSNSLPAAHSSSNNGPGSSYEGQLVSHIMEYINSLWRVDPANFAATLNTICMRAPALMQRLMDHELAANAAVEERYGVAQGGVAAPGGMSALPSAPGLAALHHPHELERALSQLPMGELTALLRHMCQYMPIGPSTSAVGRALSGAADTDGGEGDEEQVCPPLFGFASLSNADLLDSISDEVLGPEHKQRNPRPALEAPEVGKNSAAEPCLTVQPWWMNHLMESGGSDSNAGRSDADADGALKVLRWAYGAVVNTAAAQAADRRRELLNGKTADAALLQLYEDIANAWRRINDVGSKKARMQQLRRSAEKGIKDVKELEEGGVLAFLKVHSAKYVEALLPRPGALGQGDPAAPSAVRDFCEAAIKQPAQQEQMQILSEAVTIRYAHALLERETAVMSLQQSMWGEELRECGAQGQAAAERLAAAQCELATAESELNRVQLEGPANHRKRDPIDKATKEAEYREKVADLKTRIDNCTARVNTEEEQVNTAKLREETAKRQLDSTAAQLKTCMDHRNTMDALLNPNGVPPEYLTGGDREDAACLAEQPWYRILYIAQAINLYSERPYLQPGLPEARDYAQATQHCRQLTHALRSDLQKCWEELDIARQKLQELACVDLAAEITERALEVVRSRVEAAAARDREEAAARLLRELELEDAGKKAAEEKKGKKNKARKKAGKAQKGDATDGETTHTDAAPAVTETQSSSQRTQEEIDLEYEAALEQRRKEVEAERLQREQEQARLLEAITSQRSEASEVQRAASLAEEEGWTSDDEASATHASSVPVLVSGSDSFMNEADFDAATRAAIQASLEDANEEKPAGWQAPPVDGKKKRNRKQRYKDNLEKEKEAAQPKMRIVSYFGDWVCECGRQNKLWDTCKCAKAGPCRDWVRGRCKYGNECRFSHPPFDLPSGPAPPSPIARPSSDAEQLNPLAQPLPPVPPPPSAITAPGPREQRAKAVAVAASASSKSLASLPGSQQEAASLLEEQQEAAQQQPPPPPPRRPQAGDKLTEQRWEPLPHLALQPPPPPPPKPAVEAAWGLATASSGSLARASSEAAVSQAHPSSAISNSDPVVSWNPPCLAAAAAGTSVSEKPAPVQAPGGDFSADGNAARGLQQDQIVAPPKRTSSLNKILPPASSVQQDATRDSGWGQMGSWGVGGMAGNLVSAASSQSVITSTAPQPIQQPPPLPTSEAFNPFGDNPLHRALAADYRLDPVVAQPKRDLANGKILDTAPLRPGRADSLAADFQHTMTAPVRPSLPPPAPSARRSDSAQDAMALFLSQQQQGASLPMQASLGAQPPLPAPVMAKHFAAAQLSAGLAQQQQQALSQSAQWSALQGVLRGLTAKTSSADGLATLSAALASSQAAQLGQLGWQAAQQQSRAAPRYPGAPAAAGWDQRAAMANGFGSKIALARASSSPVISGQRLDEQAALRAKVPTAKPVKGVNQELKNFLDSACIALWHLPHFRDSLLALQEPQMTDSANLRVLTALRTIFSALNQANSLSTSRAASPFALPSQLNGLANGATALAQRGVNAVAVELREALALALEEVLGQSLVLPHEALEALLTCLDRALPTPPGKASIVQHLLGLHVTEAMSCGACSRQQETSGLRMVLVMPAATLRAAGNLQRGQQPTLEAMLSAHVSDVPRVCAPEQGGCGSKGRAVMQVNGSPTAFVLALAWAGPAAQVDVVAVCSAIPLKVDLRKAFSGNGTGMLGLRSMQCRYANGHATFSREAGTDSWRLFGSPSVAIGEWPAVLTQCRLHSLQPLTLFYDCTW